MKIRKLPIVLSLILIVTAVSHGQTDKKDFADRFPWCIVAYDSVDRTPAQRLELIKELGFTKYAYDWREHHLQSSKEELSLAKSNGIEVIAVWLWLNAKRDSVGKLSPSNTAMLKIVEELDLRTTLWVSMSPNFFNSKDHEESLGYSTEMLRYVSKTAQELGCQVALYNHSGWFGNPYNQLEILKALPDHDLKLVYNFHHGHEHIGIFDKLVSEILPHLIAVNLNGMNTSGPKILTIGEGQYEQKMVNDLINAGFEGPWGIMGHVDGADVKSILLNNINGLESLIKKQK